MSPTQTRHGAFLEIFQARSPIATDGFRLLRDGAADGSGAPQVRAFFTALNRELADRRAAGGETDHPWAAALCVALADAGPTAATALSDLLDDVVLEASDPLVAVVFEAAGEAAGLLDVV